MKNTAIIFDFSDTLVKMRPPRLLVKRSLIKKLASKYGLVLVTGARRGEVLNILNRFSILRLFNLVITKDDLPYQKPEKDLYWAVKRTLNFRNAIYIGDTLKDYQFAKNSKIPFLYVGKRKIGAKQDKSTNKLLEYIL